MTVKSGTRGGPIKSNEIRAYMMRYHKQLCHSATNRHLTTPPDSHYCSYFVRSLKGRKGTKQKMGGT